MTPLQIGLSALIAAGIPAIFLSIIYTLDLYASRTFRLVLLAFGWGAIGGVGISFLFNQYVAIPFITAQRLGIIWLYVAFAPLAEEIIKSLALVGYISRRAEFTYFVDGAIYGFATGIGFSIAENFLYMALFPNQGVGLSLVRSFTTCLMHGTASALVGAAIGRFRFQKRSGRWLAMFGGWGAAILLHATFNSVSKTALVPDTLVLPLSVAIGLGGVGLIAFFISLGLKEQREWLAETLDRQMGVTGAEMRAAQSYATIDEVLEPIAKQFPLQVEQIEQLLLYQAQMGIKKKVQQEIDDPKTKEQLGAEIAVIQEEMEQLRKEIGPYVMVYVRAIFPEGIQDIFDRLVERMTEQDGPVDKQRWIASLSAGKGKAEEQPRLDMFARIREAEDKEKPEA